MRRISNPCVARSVCDAPVLVSSLAQKGGCMVWYNRNRHRNRKEIRNDTVPPFNLHPNVGTLSTHS